MKKRDLTLERRVGICVLGLLVFLAISCSQDVLALTVNNLQLNVNAGTTDTTTNKIYYSAATPTAVSLEVPLVWAEKAVYTGDNADVKITVKNMAAGDLIVKVDMLVATTPGAVFNTRTTPGAIAASNTSGGGFSVLSYWLKYDNAGEFGDNPIIKMVANGGATTSTTTGGIDVIDYVNAASLPTLVLKRLSTPTSTTAGTTTTLYSFNTGFKSPTHVIFTAILVSNASAGDPQVLGVDIRSMFFNYISQTPATWDHTRAADVNTPIWLDLIQAWDHRIVTFPAGY